MPTAALQHGDLLRAAVHQRADEHHQRRAGTDLLIGLLRSKHAADACDRETVAVLAVYLLDAFVAGLIARRARQSAFPITRDAHAGTILLQVRDRQALHVVPGKHVKQFLELFPALVQRQFHQCGLWAFDLVEFGE